MALTVTVGVQVQMDGQELVSVGRSESVQAVSAESSGVDIVDLLRSVLGRLTSEAATTADEQVGQIRRLVEETT